jgi:hypothetical protein
MRSKVSMRGERSEGNRSRSQRAVRRCATHERSECRTGCSSSSRRPSTLSGTNSLLPTIHTSASGSYSRHSWSSGRMSEACQPALPALTTSTVRSGSISVARRRTQSVKQPTS